jgi:hypothetical protein
VSAPAGSFILLSSIRIPIEPCGQLLVLICLAGCAPSPEVAQASAGRERFSPTATKSPPPPDGDVTSVDPPGQPEVDADVPPPPDADDTGPTPDAAPMSRPDGAQRDLPPATQGPAQTCTLSFQVTTVTFNGSYSPHNVGAIWVSDGSGRFIKSLTVWAQRRTRYLTTWETASMGNTVDAITSATANSHGMRTGKWNCTGLDEKTVPDGPYRINVEFTERNGAGRVMTPLAFTKGGPVNLMPPDQANFRAIQLQVTTP